MLYYDVIITSLAARELILTVKFDFIFKSHPTHPLYISLIYKLEMCYVL